MHFHLVGGFLGSGKTTAIIGAAKRLTAQGKRLGIVTNDQGKYLVDTSFFRSQSLPTVEVTGGCFCCNYDDLAARLRQLEQTALPDVIFAESVGSCADVVATVVKPFLDLQSAGIRLSSFTVFTDIRLLRRRLRGMPMPYSDDVVYIYDKQIEEAGLLILNKADMLPHAEAANTLDIARLAYPDKIIRLQNSRNEADVAQWVGLLESSANLLPDASVEMDYQKYGAGENELAWLDEAFSISSRHENLQHVAKHLIRAIQVALQHRRLPIGHVKFLLEAIGTSVKISLPMQNEADWESEVPHLPGNILNVLINARVQTEAQTLSELVSAAIHGVAEREGIQITEQDVSAFHPGFPQPTHRMP